MTDGCEIIDLKLENGCRCNIWVKDVFEYLFGISLLIRFGKSSGKSK